MAVQPVIPVTPISAKTPGDLTQLVEKAKRGRWMREQQWRINLAFYKGDQYVYFNRRANRIERLPTNEGDKARYRVRLTANAILPNTRSLLSRQLKTKPVFHARASSASDKDQKAAQVSDQLLDNWWSSLNMQALRAKTYLNAMISGGFMEVCWDPSASKPMKFLIGPDGRPIADDDLEAAFRTQLEQKGVEPRELTVYMGDVDVEALSGFDVYLDVNARSFDECDWYVRAHWMTPDEIKSRWNVTLPPNGTTDQAPNSLPYTRDGQQQRDVRLVYCGKFKPTPALPKGRVVYWSPGHDGLLDDYKWAEAYPFPCLPLVKFPGVEVPDDPYDQGLIEHVIPLQKDLNRTLSQIIEHRNLSLRRQFLAPRGSMTQRMTNENGGIFEYNPIGNHKPEPIPMDSIPSYVYEHIQELRGAMREIFGLTDVLQGQVPPNVEAGVAIDLLQETATDGIAPTITAQEEALAKVASLLLQIAQQRYVEPRIIRITGHGGTNHAAKFSQAELAGAEDVVCEAGSGLPRTRAARQARVEWMLANQLIPPHMAWKFMDSADLAGASEQLQIDEDQAEREHDMLIRGMPINPDAAFQAMQQLQQSGGVDQQTGQQITPEQAQQMVQQAGVQPNVFDNAQTHWDTHTRYAKSVEFAALPPEARQMFTMHIEATMNQLIQLSEMQRSMQAQMPKTTLQLKAAATPDLTAGILSETGVQVTPDQAAEPPMDTWVSDAVDKPNAETGPSTPALAAAQEQQAQAQAQAAAQQVDQGEAKEQRAQESHDQQMQHGDDRHEAEMQRRYIEMQRAAQNGR